MWRCVLAPSLLRAARDKKNALVGSFPPKYKVWVKPSAEMSFLYGNHVQKSGLGRITENTPKYGGAVVYSMSDVPLGFGVAAQPTEFCKDLDPTAVVVLHQADVGEYLRVEDDIL